MITTNLYALAKACDVVNGWSSYRYPDTLDPSLAELYAGVMDASAALAKGCRALAIRLATEAAHAAHEVPDPIDDTQESQSTVRGTGGKRPHPQPLNRIRQGGT